MGLLEDAFKGWTGLAVGLGAAYAAPAVAPAVGGVLRPLVKGVIRTGFFVVNSIREYAAEATEELGDIYAEAQAESREVTHSGAAKAESSDTPRRRRSSRK